MKKQPNFGIIGLGNMGSALAFALKKQGYRCIYVYDKDRKKIKNLKGFYRCVSLKDLIQNSGVVILAIKPQDIREFLKATKTYFLKDKPLLVTIAAGISIKFFENYLKGLRVIRAMPNLAAKIGQSVTFIAKGKFAKDSDLRIAEKVFSSVGCVFVAQESFLDKATSISGSGPGYLYYFMDCLYESARSLGFDKRTAKKMVTQTFLGASNLVKDTPYDFKDWMRKVASKKGTTAAAFSVFEKNKFKNLVKKAVEAAYARAKEISC